MRKILLIGWGLGLSLLAEGQYLKDDRAEWVDSTLIGGAECAPIYPIFYYDIGVKYPRSSETLLKEVSAVFESERGSVGEDGYVTFQFFVNCEGVASRFSVLQTTENYQPTRFSPQLVRGLYVFTKNLDPWPAPVEAHGLSMLNYFAYVSYKIKNGKPVAVIP
jgi:hypothetical protein